MFDYPVFDFPFPGIIFVGVRISILFFRGVFVREFEFRSSNFVFSKLFFKCSSFELVLVKQITMSSF